MTMDEKLDLILLKMDGFETRMDRLESKVDSLEQRMDSFEQRMDSFEQRMDSFEQRMDGLESVVNTLKHRVDDLEQQVKLNTLTVEHAINKAIQTLGEGYKLNAERFDKLDIEAVRNKSDIALSLSRLTNEKVDRLIEKLNLSA